MKKFCWAFTILGFLTIGCAEPTMERPQGTYYGVLPCADCPGISYEIDFNTDSTFIEKRLYQSEDENILTHEGTYRINKDGNIILSGNPAVEISGELSFKNDTLKMLNSSGDTMSGNWKNNYLLTKDKPEGFIME